MATDEVVDLFAGGAGGWDLAARRLGAEPLGIEHDADACSTRAAVGLRTFKADIAQLNPADFAPVAGIIASPPCQAYSRAGKQEGRIDRPLVEQAVRHLARRGDDGKMLALRDRCRDKRSMLTAEPMRWIVTLQPEWVAFEQVPDVLALWHVYAQVLKARGYHVWTGELNAANYGVPQTRKRAILIASRARKVGPPAPTHHDARKGDCLEGLQPWVTMAQALGWAEDDVYLNGTHDHRAERPAGEPAPTVHFGARLNTVQRQVGFPRRADTPSNRAGAGRVEIDGTDYRSRDLRSEDEPAPTVTEKARSWRVLNTGRDWKEGGDRDDAQTIDPAEQPAPAVTAKSGGQWRLVANRQANAAVRSLDEPAPTITGGHDTADRVWIVDTGETRGQGEVTTDGRVRSEDEPAPVLTSRADQMQWTTERPATTMQGDARVFSPGEHRNADRPEAPGRSENAIRVEPWEAGVLQGFPPDYPWSGRTITAIFQQIGNAIPPQLAHAILAEVIGA